MSLSSQESLPFPPTPSASVAGRTMQESVYAQRVQPRRLPDDAPNILIVLIDDAGPGLPTTYGGEVRTDALTRIHNEGIGFNRFRTTAMCSPTRASLMTGRNHHRIGNGQIAELANDWDGYAGEIPKSSALAAEVLKDYGYAGTARYLDVREGRGLRVGTSAGQRPAVLRPRLPRHPYLPRWPRLAGLATTGSLPVQRPHQRRQRPLHSVVMGPPPPPEFVGVGTAPNRGTTRARPHKLRVSYGKVTEYQRLLRTSRRRGPGMSIRVRDAAGGVRPARHRR